MSLPDLWFTAIAALWAGYLFLEGFVFGAGVLTRALARDAAERRLLIGTVAPVWAGNEGWLLAACAATAAAFPAWAAALAGAFAVPLPAILAALVLRAAAFACRDRRDGERWRRGWDVCVFFGSLAPAFLWGVIFGNVVRGVELDAAHRYTGGFWALLNVPALAGGLTTLLLFLFQGAVFAALRTSGGVRERARAMAGTLGGGAITVTAVALLWTQAARGSAWTAATAAVAAAALLAAAALVRAGGRDGAAFAAAGTCVAAATITLFASLYPVLLPAVPNPADGLTVAGAAAPHPALVAMTWTAAVALPAVLLYQARTCRAFRRRVAPVAPVAPVTPG
ncbi:cytochrome d ubiquinol oxidase subunit II [Actinomadura parmotrematis]|uniref:Cytochrome d ubiquinol oxidase subunit II n=1 Tax=Actinomadura parmotrematis TaxID=2864039 RepID=A0ABS7G0N3_9ACTN|nr:cytochrome d ubiquinol oxidase subunit II [Actinomadura parmotrematis]MBW8486274.1 cytochrome d ubiquinol oxidase subunit II [Actinomadura parmotrematis]